MSVYFGFTLSPPPLLDVHDHVIVLVPAQGFVHLLLIPAATTYVQAVAASVRSFITLLHRDYFEHIKHGG